MADKGLEGRDGTVTVALGEELIDLEGSNGAAVTVDKQVDDETAGRGARLASPGDMPVQSTDLITLGSRLQTWGELQQVDQPSRDRAWQS